MLRQQHGLSRRQMPTGCLWLLLLTITVPGGVRSFLSPRYQPMPHTILGRSEHHSSSCLIPQESASSARSICPATGVYQPFTPVVTLQARLKDGDDDQQQPRESEKLRPPSKRRALVQNTRGLYRRIRKRTLVPIAASLMFWMGATRGAPPAHAKMANDATKTPTYSLRPGMSTADIEDVLAGKSDIKNHDPTTTTTSPTPTSTSTTSTTVPKSKSSSIYGADFDDEEDFDDLDDDNEVYTFERQKATKEDQQRALKIQSGATSQFAGYRKEKNTMLYVKVGAGLFLPTFGTMFVREHFRQRKEEAYVQKGLEILEAQKAEYFNVTSTSEDSDLEDELKDLKNNSTDTDDDEDDDDDDDDDTGEDDDDRPSRRKGPKRPKGPSGGDDTGGGTSSGGGSSGFDPGYGQASDEDKEKLKDLFNKS